MPDDPNDVGAQTSEPQEPPAPNGETKADAFKRLAKARMIAALDKIRLLGNLSAKGQYEYTDKQVLQMRAALDEQLDASFARFADRKPDDGFSFDD